MKQGPAFPLTRHDPEPPLVIQALIGAAMAAVLVAACFL